MSIFLFVLKFRTKGSSTDAALATDMYSMVSILLLTKIKREHYMYLHRLLSYQAKENTSSMHVKKVELLIEIRLLQSHCFALLFPLKLIKMQGQYWHQNLPIP